MAHMARREDQYLEKVAALQQSLYNRWGPVTRVVQEWRFRLARAAGDNNTASKRASYQ